MAKMNENPYQSPRSLVAVERTLTLRDLFAYPKSLKDAAWSGMKLGALIGLVLGVATAAAIIVAVSYPPQTLHIPWQRLPYLVGACLFIVFLSTLIGAIGTSLGLGTFAAMD